MVLVWLSFWADMRVWTPLNCHSSLLSSADLQHPAVSHTASHHGRKQAPRNIRMLPSSVNAYASVCLLCQPPPHHTHTQQWVINKSHRRDETLGRRCSINRRPLSPFQYLPSRRRYFFSSFFFCSP